MTLGSKIGLGSKSGKTSSTLTLKVDPDRTPSCIARGRVKGQQGQVVMQGSRGQSYPHRVDNMTTKQAGGDKEYQGNRPSPGDGWDHIDTIEADGSQWLIFSKAQRNPEWVFYKIVANGKVTKKANYWVTRNIMTGQLAFNRDIAVMREHRPDLHQKIELAINIRESK